MLNGNYACFYFANGDFRGKWERLTEAMGSSTAKGGAAFPFMMRDGELLKETAWRAAHNRQAAHVLLLPFLGSMRNRLAVNLCTARRYKPVI
ncbi:hypothetical protein DEO72_LG2g3013 [Vigna unguiculata]|uniref:Uncharacterized protein n=1 Tax=Vigna unguiculata TaxID=3917 RepID=A0A4D6L2G0_VIGUN|nr:hypothetical protein DEO72_LG2g3013 [Vigna unguiculata]